MKDNAFQNAESVIFCQFYSIFIELLYNLIAKRKNGKSNEFVLLLFEHGLYLY